MSVIRLVDSLSIENWANIQKLTDMVEKNKKTMNLDMSEFHGKPYKSKTDHIEHLNTCEELPTEEDFKCGSTCCAVGYAAFWSIGRNVDNFSDKYGMFDYDDYSHDAFCDNEYITIDGRYVLLWDYLFSHNNINCVDDLLKRLNNILKLKA